MSNYYLMRNFDDYFGSGAAAVFDCDDVLIRSTDKVIIQNGLDISEYTTAEWAKVDKSKLDFSKVDLSQFHKGLTNATPIVSNIERLLEHFKNHDAVFILTARGNRSKIHKDLTEVIKEVVHLLHEDVNLDVDKILPIDNIFAMDDQFLIQKLGIPGKLISERKAFVIQHIILDEYGFKKVYFYDDDEKNILAIRELNDKRIESIHIQ